MIREQRQDRKNNTALSSQTNAEHAYSFGLRGDDKAAIAAIETTRKLTAADVAANLLSPQDAKERVDTARKSYLSGKMVHEYEQARAQGKGEQYLKSVADKKPSYLSDTDYLAVTNNLRGYVSNQDALRSQDQQLRVTQFANSIAINPMASDMPQQLQDLKSNVSPEAYQKAQLQYVEAVKKYTHQNGEVNAALVSWSDPSAFARVPEKAINTGFDRMVASYVNQRQQQGNPISQEDAEVQVAAVAGGKVPAFINGLKNKLNSGNPQMMEAAAMQIDKLYSANASHAIVGLSDSDKSIFTQYKALRDSLPPEEAAKIAIQNANQDPDTQKMNKEKWSNFVKSQTYSSLSFRS